jgi:phage terminase large subunit GpA-like protein
VAHESGAQITISACMVDSGYKQDAVFRFVKSMPGRNVFASKGVDDAKAPLSRASRANRDKVKVFTINPVTFKDILFQRLKRRAGLAAATCASAARRRRARMTRTFCSSPRKSGSSSS